MRLLAVLAVLAVALTVSAGCRPFSAKDDPAEPSEPVIELTDAARQAIHRVGREAAGRGKYRLRVFVVPGGCQGMQSKLDVDLNEPATTDTEYACGDVRCVYATDQYPLIQGTQVDYGTEKGQTGFLMTYPNKTAANRQKTEAWIQDESRKRTNPPPPTGEPV